MDNTKYEIVYWFVNCNGEEREDTITNNGKGFTLEEVKHLCNEMKLTSVVEITSVTYRPLT